MTFTKLIIRYLNLCVLTISIFNDKTLIYNIYSHITYYISNRTNEINIIIYIYHKIAHFIPIMTLVYNSPTPLRDDMQFGLTLSRNGMQIECSHSIVCKIFTYLWMCASRANVFDVEFVVNFCFRNR